jgi:divalent metal cation (Fe/Co/Zn/Cd) transporter
VSGLLIAGGFGIGIHSFDLLWSTLHNQQDSSQQQQELLLDPNAAWFALGSVLVKEWLYRISKFSDYSTVP